MLDGVLGEVHHRLGQPLAIGHDAGLGGVLEAPVAIGQRPGPGVPAACQITQVEGFGAQEVGLFDLGQQEEVVDDAAHAVELVEDQGDGRPAVVGVLVQQLEVAPDDGDRCAQLVAGVVEEGLLGGEGAFQAIEHVVEGAAQLGHLVGASDLDAAAEVRLPDRARRLGQHADGPQ